MPTGSFQCSSFLDLLCFLVGILGKGIHHSGKVPASTDQDPVLEGYLDKIL